MARTCKICGKELFRNEISKEYLMCSCIIYGTEEQKQKWREYLSKKFDK